MVRISLLLLVLCSCRPPAATLPGPQGQGATELTLGTSVTLAPDELYRLPEGRSPFTFAGVKNDSRCPRGTNCVMAGEAIVRLKVEDAVREVRLGANNRRPPVLEVPGGQLTLTALLPYPTSGSRIDPASYRLEVTVAGPGAGQ